MERLCSCALHYSHKAMSGCSVPMATSNHRDSISQWIQEFLGFWRTVSYYSEYRKTLLRSTFWKSSRITAPPMIKLRSNRRKKLETSAVASALFRLPPVIWARSSWNRLIRRQWNWKSMGICWNQFSKGISSSQGGQDRYTFQIWTGMPKSGTSTSSSKTAAKFWIFAFFEMKAETVVDNASLNFCTEVLAWRRFIRMSRSSLVDKLGCNSDVNHIGKTRGNSRWVVHPLMNQRRMSESE